MKTLKLRIFRVVFITSFVLGSADLSALDIILGYHPFPADAARASIDERVAEMYHPIAINVDPERGIDMLYFRDEQASAGAAPVTWILYEFDDFSVLDADFTAFLREGFVPMDISGGLNSLMVMFVRSSTEITGWRLTAGQPDQESVSQTIESYRQQGFELHGLSYSDEQMWFLFLKIGTRDAIRSTVTYTVNDVRAIETDVSRRVATGWFPTALAVLPDDQIVLAYRLLVTR